jgi:Fe-only nitrogenase accessory protein AnfO
MSEKNFLIAVTQTDGGELSTIHSTQKIMLFHKDENDWQIDKIIDFNFSGITGLAEMRRRLIEMAALLANVKALISKGYGGLSMEVLSKFDFTLYELSGFKAEVLSAIASGGLDDGEDNFGQADGEGEGNALPPKEPCEIEPGSGEYFLDLALALKSYPELTTKKILRPFFETRDFLTLKLVFDHFPPWLAGELKARNLAWDAREMPGGLLIEISSEIAKPCRPLTLN